MTACGGGGSNTFASTEAASKQSSSARTAQSSTRHIAARLGEFSIKLARASAPSGPVTFTIRNDGRVPHEFVVLRTDLAAGHLPGNRDEVKEKGAGKKIDEAEKIQPGTTAKLTVNLPRGRYVIICNLRRHYSGGMHAALRVD